MRLRNLFCALALTAATAVGTPSAATADVTTTCFNHSVSGEFICHFYESGSLIAVSGGSGTSYLFPWYMWF